MAIFAPHERLPSSATLPLSGVVEDLSSALALSILLNTSVSASPGKTVLTSIPGNGDAEEEEEEKNPRDPPCHYFLRSFGILEWETILEVEKQTCEISKQCYHFNVDKWKLLDKLDIF